MLEAIPDLGEHELRGPPAARTDLPARSRRTCQDEFPPLRTDGAGRRATAAPQEPGCASSSPTTRCCCARGSPGCSTTQGSRSSAQSANADDLMLKVRSYTPDVAIVGHPHAADPDRRGPARGAGDPRGRTRRSACSCSPSTSSPPTRWSCSPRARRASATCSRTASRTWTSSPQPFAASPRAALPWIPRVVTQLVGRRRQRRPAGGAHATRARGARADGRGPFEPGDRRAPLHHRRAPSRSTSRASSGSSGSRRHPRTTGACSPCSPSCARSGRLPSGGNPTPKYRPALLTLGTA